MWMAGKGVITLGLLKDLTGLSNLSRTPHSGNALSPHPVLQTLSPCLTRYYNWTTAAPLLLAMQAFQKPLPKVSANTIKKRGPRRNKLVGKSQLNSRNLRLWRRDAQEDPSQLFRSLSCALHASLPYQGKAPKHSMVGPQPHSQHLLY